MRAIALDPAPRNTGYAIGDADVKVPVFGKLSLASWGDEEGDRLLAFGRRLTDLCRKYSVTHIFREQLPPGITQNSTTYQHQVMVLGEIARVAAKLALPCAVVLIADWRTRFLGTARALPGLKGDHGRKWLKEQSIAACARRNWFVEDPDAAEACGILDYALATLDRGYCGRTDSIFRRNEMRADEQRRAG